MFMLELINDLKYFNHQSFPKIITIDHLNLISTLQNIRKIYSLVHNGILIIS